mmetsp:Transcript_15622/g.36201  ORF Transcript_15622/g.36201 Transcript_15622/m.36201 type:complete len:234 (-) Transcript_15622:235-936(-)
MTFITSVNLRRKSCTSPRPPSATSHTRSLSCAQRRLMYSSHNCASACELKLSIWSRRLIPSSRVALSIADAAAPTSAVRMRASCPSHTFCVAATIAPSSRARVPSSPPPACVLSSPPPPHSSFSSRPRANRSSAISAARSSSSLNPYFLSISNSSAASSSSTTSNLRFFTALAVAEAASSAAAAVFAPEGAAARSAVRSAPPWGNLRSPPALGAALGVSGDVPCELVADRGCS